MKKFTSKVFAGIFAAAVMATAAFASDYSEDPGYGIPDTEVVENQTVTDAIATATATGDDAKVELEDVGGSLTADAVTALKTAGRDVVITNNGVTIEIPKAEVAKLDGAVDLTMGVTKLDADTQLANKVEVSKDAVMIGLAADDGTKFGATLSVTVPCTIANPVLYHVDGKGNVSVVKDGAKANANGTVTVSISGASYYIIAEDGAVKGADGNVNTGVVLPIALVALAGGSVAVSAIAAKKRK